MAPLPPRRPGDLSSSSVQNATLPATTPPLAKTEGLVGPPACFGTFSKRGGIALPVASDTGSGACAIAEPVTFRAISTPDGSEVELDSAITVTRPFAVEILDWVREDLSGIVSREKGKLARLIGVRVHACRPRYGVVGAQISEHATGNALDIVGLRLEDGRTLSLVGTETATRSLREGLKHLRALQNGAWARLRRLAQGSSAPRHEAEATRLQDLPMEHRMTQERRPLDASRKDDPMPDLIDDLERRYGPGPLLAQIRQDVKRGGELMATYRISVVERGDTRDRGRSARGTRRGDHDRGEARRRGGSGSAKDQAFRSP